MQDTLIRIGQHIVANQSELDKIIAVPDLPKKNNKGEDITYYVLNIICDLNDKEVIIDNLNISKYDAEKSPERLMHINSDLWGRRGNPLAVSIELKKAKILKRSISGEFASAIERSFPEYMNRPFFKILGKCKQIEGLSEKIDKKYITDKIKLNKNEKLIMIYVTVKSSDDGLEKPTPFKEIDGYIDYIKERFLTSPKEGEKKLCYSSGEILTTVKSAELMRQAAFTNIYQTTLINSAAGFEKNTFSKNYQLDASTIAALDTSISYLKKSKLQIRIAGLTHNIIPQFPSKSEFDLGYIESRISKNIELLFQTPQLNDFGSDIEDEVGKIYWLNFVAYETDGNYYKITNQIKGVSNLHLNKTAKALKKAGKDLEHLIYSANAEKKFPINFITIFYLIPTRKGEKDKKNIALILFKQILENRKIDAKILFKHFTELILCHKYERHDAYGNMRYNPSEFYYGVKDAVYKYLALFKALQQLDLLKNHSFMEEKNKQQEKESVGTFFEKMGYNPSQQAMFHLGRVLNSVALAQKKKGYTKMPVLNKINYNGMERKAIVKLRVDLREKVNQFDLHGFNIGHFDSFTKTFPAQESKWELSPKEAVFFILSGYAYNPSR